MELSAHWTASQPTKGSPEWEALRDRLLGEWQQQKQALEAAKARELVLRNELISLAFNPDKQEGTERIPLNNGWQLAATKELNYSFTSDKELAEALLMLADVGEEGKFIAPRLVKFDARLVVGEYKKLDKQYKEVIDLALKVKPAATKLELIPPKGTTAR